MRSMKRARGLTLVELMVTLVVLALLSAIAYPLYQTQVRKARRVEAKTALMGIALAQERYLTRVGSYATAAQLGDEYDEQIERMTDRNGDGTPDYYSIVVAATTTSFSVTGTAIGVQAADGDCATFVVNQLGQRTATGADPDICW